MKFFKKLDTVWYIENNPDVAASNMSAEDHYRLFGKAEGRRPCAPTIFERYYMRSRVILDVSKALASRKGGYIALLKLFFKILKSEGIRGVKSRILFFHNSKKNKINAESYSKWLCDNDKVDHKELIKRAALCQKATNAPLLSIVMATYNTPVDFLSSAIQSINNQAYTKWEFCIADDASSNMETIDYLKSLEKSDDRIKILFREKNGHISEATNTALSLAVGDFIVFMDHDDELHPAALTYVAETIINNPKASLIYSDEDKIDEYGNRSSPYFKSDFNYELLLTQNMLCHLVVVRKSIVDEIGGLDKNYNGAQDHDFVLKVYEKIKPENIVHLPKVLYHWRIHSASTAASTEAKPYAVEAGRNAVRSHLQRVGIKAEVVAHPEVPFWHRVKFLLEDEPSIEIIIPTRDRIDLMRMCIKSILELTKYNNYHITIVDNGSVEEQTLNQFREWEKNSLISVLRDNSPFNYSRLNNIAVANTQAEFVCLLNNDIEIISPDWLTEMVSHAARSGVGCVGARLWYPDNTLQHGGIILGIGGVAGHSHKYFAKNDAGYFGRAVSLQVLSAVTAACLLVKRSTYLAVDGLDEKIKVAFNDVDFCLRVREAGYRNIWTPFAEMYHHESASRGREDNPEKAARFRSEVEFMKKRWDQVLTTDPYYSPNLTLVHENFSLAETARVVEY